MASLKDADIYLILPITMFCFLPQKEPGYILYKIIYFDFRPLVGWHKKNMSHLEIRNFVKLMKLSLKTGDYEIFAPFYSIKPR